jgi:hypothetical protein
MDRKNRAADQSTISTKHPHEAAVRRFLTVKALVFIIYSQAK